MVGGAYSTLGNIGRFVCLGTVIEAFWDSE